MHNDNEELQLHATQRGYVTTYFWTLVWCVIIYFVGIHWADIWSSHVLAKSSAESWSEFWSSNKWSIRGHQPEMVLSLVAYYGGFVLIAGLVLGNIFYNFFYAAHQINILLADGMTLVWKTITKIEYSFPFGRTETVLNFDRIISITVSQTMIDRILNTGTLHMRVITFTNADSKEQTVAIPAVYNPHHLKEFIEENTSEHEGVLVEFRK